MPAVFSRGLERDEAYCAVPAYLVVGFSRKRAKVLGPEARSLLCASPRPHLCVANPEGTLLLLPSFPCACMPAYTSPKSMLPSPPPAPYTPPPLCVHASLHQS